MGLWGQSEKNTIHLISWDMVICNIKSNTDTGDGNRFFRICGGGSCAEWKRCFCCESSLNLMYIKHHTHWRQIPWQSSSCGRTFKSSIVEWLRIMLTAGGSNTVDQTATIQLTCGILHSKAWICSSNLAIKKGLHFKCLKNNTGLEW